MALFRDYNFGDAMYLFHNIAIFFKFVVKILIRLVFFSNWLTLVIFLTKKKHDHVSVLFNRSRFTEVREHWPFVLPLFYSTRELRQC